MPVIRSGATLAGRAAAFLGRIGGTVVAPRETLLRALDDGEGGLDDLLIVVLLQVAALTMPKLAHSFWLMVDATGLDGLASILQTVAQEMVIPVGGAISGAVALRVFGGPRPSSRLVDVAALAIIPGSFVRFGLRVGPMFYLRPNRWVRRGVLAIAGLWFGALLLLVLYGARQDQDRGQATA